MWLAWMTADCSPTSYARLRCARSWLLAVVGMEETYMDCRAPCVLASLLLPPLNWNAGITKRRASGYSHTAPKAETVPMVFGGNLRSPRRGCLPRSTIVASNAVVAASITRTQRMLQDAALSTTGRESFGVAAERFMSLSVAPMTMADGLSGQCSVRRRACPTFPS